MSVTMPIVLVCFGVWLLNGILFPDNNTLTAYMAVHTWILRVPEYWWQFLTAGFAHAPNSLGHVAFNMLALVMFGYGLMLGIGPDGMGIMRGENVEQKLGKLEYLAFYLATIIIGNITFCVINYANGSYQSSALGASGGVTGVVILFALLYPHKTMLLMGIIPMPMWAIGVLIILSDAMGNHGYGNSNVAYSIHLTGAAFAALYYFVFLQNGIKMTRPLVILGTLLFAEKKPQVKIYDEPPAQDRDALPVRPAQKNEAEIEFERRLDEILDRIGEVGESGLTSEERKFLHEASRRYKNKYKK